MRLQLPWPELVELPAYGLVRTRQDFDDILARHAVKHGARLRERTNVTGPVLDERTGRVVGVTAKLVDDDGRATGAEVTFRAPLVVAADGNSSRLSLSIGLPKRDDRPMGVAVRTYYTSPRHDDDWLESLARAVGPTTQGRSILLPGYGWIFGVGDGTSNVGLGILNTSKAFGKVDYKDVLQRWVADDAGRVGATPTTTMTGPIRGAALPMGFNRQPHYDRGLLLVGDAGGMVNPFNGEGIAYAMESGRLAADVIAQALRPAAATPGASGCCSPTRGVMKDALGGYYTLGRGFVQADRQPRGDAARARSTACPGPRDAVPAQALANLAEPHGGDAIDRLITRADQDGAGGMTPGSRSLGSSPIGRYRRGPDAQHPQDDRLTGRERRRR